jgi:gluconokinase
MPTKADIVRHRAIVVVMGPAGAGKTTVGRELAQWLGVPFEDADSFHTIAAVEKMRRGEALGDEDREPWLDALSRRLAAAGQHGLVLACSALKAKYRQRLGGGGSCHYHLVYLEVPPAILEARLAQRTGHFAGLPLLGSQLATLEVPTAAETYDGTSSPAELVREIVRRIGL